MAVLAQYHVAMGRLVVAHEGTLEILLSQRVRAALGDAAASRPSIEPAGEFALKGFQRPVAAWRVRTGA